MHQEIKLILTPWGRNHALVFGVAKREISRQSVDFQEQFGSTCRRVYADCSRRNKARSESAEGNLIERA